ncbi:ubiquitin protein ligase E3 [Apiospora kogelbergensis]|uniref:HECT-type E3 ubiquitin transferase n=1 Tax=Apiospora kogelbergensis TaxID=1337665 RepID=A0AAW0R6I3_9PEZI
MSLSAATIPHRGPPSPQRRNGTTTRAPMPNPRLHAAGLDIFYRGPPQQHADSSSEEDDDFLGTKPKPKPAHRIPSHSRSMSHPFPSLFTTKKKKPIGFDDSTDDDCVPSRLGTTSSGPNMASTARKQQRGPIDFRNGNCMTCGGLVRWPKELDVFRCTICLTINDLKPLEHSSGDAAKPTIAPTIPSLEHTRHLVQESLRRSVRHYIDSAGRAESPSKWPRRSSSRGSDDYFSQLPLRERHQRSASRGTPPPIYVRTPVFDETPDESSELGTPGQNGNAIRSYSSSFPDQRSAGVPLRSPVPVAPPNPLDAKVIFKPVEEYLMACFRSHEHINAAFITQRQSFSSSRPAQFKIPRKPVPAVSTVSAVSDTRREKIPVAEDPMMSEQLDPRLLLLGNFAENGMWWTGNQQEVPPTRARSARKDDAHSLVTSRTPRIDWGLVMEWYHTVTNTAEGWTSVYDELTQKDPSTTLTDAERSRYEALLLDAQEHLQRVLLKCTENLLKRPGRTLKDPEDVRFLLLILANPLLQSGHKSYSGTFPHMPKEKTGPTAGQREAPDNSLGRHSGIIKRIFGLLSNAPDVCQHHLVTWFSKLPEHLFLQTKDLIGGFVTYRLSRQDTKKREQRIDVMAGLIPQMANGRTNNTPATLHAALEATNASRKQKKPPEPPKGLPYADDWQVKAASKVMALLFAANNLTHVRRNEPSTRHAHGHLLATSDFYSSLLDCMDFKADFEEWEARKGKFAFCQYPFFLSIWAKIQILEFDAKRQMAGKAREAFFDSIMSNRNYTQYLFLSVRRDCLVEDSLKQVSEVVGSGSEDIKKGLRIEFRGEEGIDAGGLRKEWFLLLVREVFNPDHGLFVFDEDSQYCYFNPNTFETSDQYFLVGVLLGLAIYNSTILDIALPPFAFRKLLAAAPQSAASGTAIHQRSIMTYTLDELAEYRPRLARGLRQLLEYEGDVQSTFCLDFVIDVDKYGDRVRVPLCPGGDTKMVTNSNRREYVDLYVRYLLDTSVSRQFEPFKRGFFTVCAGNALSLFRPEEIELLVRGSDEPLDITSLRAVATYSSWNGSDKPASEPEDEPSVEWFWETLGAATPQDQRRLLSFITGSDRIPATGAASLVIKITCLGPDTGRYPTARTCFNVLNLYQYQTRERLETSLWRAVNDSEGFGLR